VRYREFPPPPALGHLVECFWTLDSDGDHRAPQRVVPDGHPELIVNSGRPFEACDRDEWHRQPRSFLAGQIEGPLLLRPDGPARILGIRFHPHGAAALFGPRMHELTGRFTTVADLSPALSRDLHNAVDSGLSIPRVAAALRDAEARSRTRDRLIEEAVRRFLRAPGSDMAAMAGELGIGLRQFERRFRASVGLSPKLFARMRRFLRVFRAMEQPDTTWVAAAVDCGYYDQAHLIRDFRQFTGQTPAVLTAPGADLARHFLEQHGVSHSYNTTAGGAV
jgi:AraC-like DNA-binding protein